jgi:hypothetical protein
MNKKQELAAMLAGVDRLADLMKKRLLQKHRQGYDGGLDPDYRDQVAAKLRLKVTHITGCPCCGDGSEKADDTFAHAVDIANLAMMLGLQDEKAR